MARSRPGLRTAITAALQTQTHQSAVFGPLKTIREKSPIDQELLESSARDDLRRSIADPHNILVNQVHAVPPSSVVASAR